jgi:hypothetical protein
MCTPSFNPFQAAADFVGGGFGTVASLFSRSPATQALTTAAPAAAAAPETPSPVRPLANPEDLVQNTVKDAYGNLVRRNNARASLRIDLQSPGSTPFSGPPTIGSGA